MMTEQEWTTLKEKIEREFSIRLKLAELAGRPKINPKNYKACEEFDATIPELFLEIALNRPENVPTALELIKTVK